MDKQKLIRIIIKDLDELKILSEEIAETEGDASLIVDLALSKAKLLTQEIDLLHEYSGKAKISYPEDQPEVQGTLEDEDEDSEVNYPEPELEILHFDVPDLVPEEAEESVDEKEDTVEEESGFEPEEEIEQEPDEVTEDEADLEEDAEVEAEIEEKEGAEADQELQDKEIEEKEEVTEDIDFEESEEEETIVYDEEEDEIAERAEKEDEFEEEPEVQVSELKDDSLQEVREIHIDELDDDDSDSFRFAPVNTPADRPVMHEIPIPENAVKEKQVIGETFRKEKSLNDAMAEKAGESNLSNGRISSLRASIGLNDRFLFIREIFGNNAERYNTIIDNLDKLETIQQAVEYLKANLSLEKNETSMKFVDLLKRRFNK